LIWWRYDTNLTTRAERAEAENLELRERLTELELEISRLAAATREPEDVVISRRVVRKTKPKRRTP
jgi:predicted nuclease with TOPRIM domain